MNNDSVPRNANRSPGFLAPVVVTLIVVALAYAFGGAPLQKILHAYQKAHLHWPDVEKIAKSTLAVHIHLGVAVFALLLGALQFMLPKGTRRHRGVGYLWLSLMLIAAILSFFLRSINHGQVSLIHLFSIFTLVTVPRIVWHARQGRIAEHRNLAVSLYIGGLVVTGALAFLPRRLLWPAFFN